MLGWTALVVLALPWPPLAALVMAFLFFSAFALFHDAAHGSLGLPGAINDVILALTSIPLVMSAHGQRQLHLRHHAHPLQPEDLEGAGALSPLWWAAVSGPIASLKMRAVAFSAVNGRVRPWVIVENVLNVGTLAVAIIFGGTGVRAVVAMALALQLTMNAWASHIPHRAPRWLIAVASKLAWTKSPVVLSLVYHLEHHAHPRVPCAELRAGVEVASPLLAHNEIREPKLGWAQLQVETRPRPAA